MIAFLNISFLNLRDTSDWLYLFMIRLIINKLTYKRYMNNKSHYQNAYTTLLEFFQLEDNLLLIRKNTPLNNIIFSLNPSITD